MRRQARKAAAHAKRAFEAVQKTTLDPAPAVEASLRGAGRFARVLRAAFARFNADNLTVRANSIAYAIVLSIIPLFTVLIRVANVNREDLSRNLARFLAAYGITDASQILSILDEILARSYAITGVGVLFMLYSATVLLQNLEGSFNYIYRARRERPLVIRFSLYIAAFVILPAVAVGAWSGGRYFINELRPPDFVDAVHAGPDRYWIAATDGTVRRLDGDKITVIDLRTRVDDRAQLREFCFDVETGEAGPAYKLITDPGYAPARLGAGDFFGVRRIAAAGDAVHVLSDNGALFHSYDGGRSWTYEKLCAIDRRIHPLELNDLRLDARGRLQILATADSASLLIYFDGAAEFPRWNFRNLKERYTRFAEPEDRAAPPETPPDAAASQTEETTETTNAANSPTDAAASGAETGPPPPVFILGRGKYLYSFDDGQSYAGPTTATFGGQATDLQAAALGPRGELFFAGRGGAFWMEFGSSQVAPELHAEFGQTVRDVRIGADGYGALLGGGGLLRFTFDGGRTWLKPDGALLSENELYRQVASADGGALVAGESSALFRIERATISDERDARGRPLASYNYVTLTRAPLIKSALLEVIAYGLIFAALFAIFSLAYIYIPNAHVARRPALIGAGITAAALLGFLILFRTFMGGSSTTAYIYGVWAALPLGMLVILSSTQIILFGLTLAYVLQHPELYLTDPERKHRTRGYDSLLWNSILLLALSYHSLYRKRRPLTDETALRFFEGAHLRVDSARERMVAAGLLAYEATAREYYPVRPAGAVTLLEIQKAILEGALAAPDDALDARLQKGLAAIRPRLRIDAKRSDADLTIADFVPLMEDADSAEDVSEQD